MHQATVLSHTVGLECVFPQGGNAVRFFLFVFFLSGSVSFVVFCRSSFLRVVVWKNFRERTFVFGWLCWSCVFLVGFCYCFCFIFGGSLPKLSGKNSLVVRSGVSSGSFSFPLVFSPTSFFAVFFFLRDKDQVVTGHPFTRTCFVVPLFFFVSRRFSLFRPFWPCVPLLGVFSGVPFWAPGGFGILLELMGLELVRSPLPRPFSWDARRQGFCVFLLPCFSCPLFVLRPHFV